MDLETDHMVGYGWPMSIARRPKEPAKLRREILDAAAAQAVGRGLGALTVEAVCRAAGVAKGGFFHHFPSKAALVTALFDDLIARFEAALAETMAGDPLPAGRFSRAYARAVTAPDSVGSERLWAAASFAMLSDPVLRDRWGGWLSARVAEAGETGDSRLAMARLAADGLWLADLCGTAPGDEARAAMVDAIVAMTEGEGGR
ncbi:TetR/AcrR family transcriptional regulator [Frigidibacter sp. MR17.24]|uniref:TetR/AcrR family transcriptional regulator n=1 Tax=Frigidibacter sp. MR17.24 TaxID=3127345 RepID=UPI003012DEDA